MPTLRGEIRQIFELINFQKINEIAREYSENDPSIQEVVNYIQSDEIEAAWNKFIDSSEVEDIVHWMRSHGVDFKNEVQHFSMIPDSLIITPSRLRVKRNVQNYSIQAFEEEVKEQILVRKLNDLIDKLIEDGNDFAHLYLILQLSRPSIEKIFHEPEVISATENLRKYGIDLDDLKVLTYNVLRWN